MIEVHSLTSGVLVSGKHDPLIQMKSSITFAQDAPGYGPLANDTVLSDIQEAYNGNCSTGLSACNAGGNDTVCHDALVLCTHEVFAPTIGDRNPDDLRQNYTEQLTEEDEEDDYSDVFSAEVLLNLCPVLKRQKSHWRQRGL